MKTARYWALAALVLCCPLAPLVAIPDAGTGTAISADARAEILSATEREIPEARLGEWKAVVDASCFLVMRRAEIWRGPMKVIVTENQSADARLYPDATFVITSGLLDAIDGYLFDTAGSSSRRMRNLGPEREALIVPFLASEAARFASGSEDALVADPLAPAILEAAGFSAATYASWLDTLEKLEAPDSAYAKSFAAYASRTPAPSARKTALASGAEKIEKYASDMTLALSCAAENVSLDEAIDSLAELEEAFPDNWWFKRIRAIAAHKRWLASLSAERIELATLFPLAGRGDGELSSILQSKDIPRRAGLANAISAIPGNQDLYLAGVEAYRTALAIRNEPGLASSFAALLVHGGNASMRDQAYALAKRAAEEDAANAVNFAGIGFLLDRDIAQSTQTLEANSTEFAEGATMSRDIKSMGGFPGDERAVALNAAIVLRAAGKQDKAKRLFDAVVKKSAMPSKTKTPLVLRRARVGDDSDSLVAAWGEPAEILYTANAEFWNYPYLAARASVARGASGALEVRSIALGPGSPISFGNDARIGDDAKAFAAWAGKPAYRSGDCDVYIVDGNTISVFALAGVIRSVRVGN